jgi:hypothetical protein
MQLLSTTEELSFERKVSTVEGKHWAASMLTFKRRTYIYFVREGRSPVSRCLPQSLLSLFRRKDSSRPPSAEVEITHFTGL